MNAILDSGRASARGSRRVTRVARRCTRSKLAVLAAAAALALPLPAAAQSGVPPGQAPQSAARTPPPSTEVLPDPARPSVTLRVVDSTGVTVAGAELTVPGSSLRAVTDIAGTFRIVTRTVGMISARVGRLGYRTASIMLPAAIGEPGTITLTLVPDVPLGLVVARASSPRTTRGEADGGTDAKVPGLSYRRAIAGGHVFTRADLERRNPSLLSDILRSVPGLQFRTGPDIPRTSSGSGRNRAPVVPRCSPSVWIDGVRSPAAEVDVDNIPPHTLEAVEVYSGATAIPSEFRDTETRSACGAVLLWSRREGGESLRSLRPPVLDAAPGRLEEVVAQHGAYTATMVDSAARLDEGSIRLVYPSEARNVAGGGTVVAEFVVDTTGRVMPELIRVVGATNGMFADAARWAIPGARFRPAVMGGVRVPQLVQQIFRFDNDWRY